MNPRHLHPRIGFTSQRPKRCGMTLLEAGVALLVMSVAMVAVVELVGAATKQRRASRQRHVALLELANEAERLASLSFDEATSERLSSWEPSAMLRSVITEPGCRMQVTDESEQPRARRIELTITWKNAAGQNLDPSTLTIWKFRQESAP